MEKRRLGRTGLDVTCLGLGGMGILNGREASPTEGTELVQEAILQGITLIETGRGYFDSEKIIGAAMPAMRDKVVLASKTYMRSAQRAQKELEESLERLRTKKIDIYQIHYVQYPQELEQVMAKGGALEALKDARSQGLIDFIGVTSHNPEVLIEALKTDQFDTVQLPLSVVEREFFDRVYPVARDRDIGIMIMKSLCGGNIKSITQALRYVLSHEVASVLIGCQSIEELKEDIEVAEHFRPLSDQERTQLFEEARNLPDKFCRRCRYCERRCPAAIPVSDIFRIEDYLILSATYARDEYRKLKKNVTDCKECGQCEKACPYGLPVRDYLKRAHKRLTRGKVEDFAVNVLRRLKLYDLARKLFFDLVGRVPRR